MKLYISGRALAPLQVLKAFCKTTTKKMQIPNVWNLKHLDEGFSTNTCSHQLPGPDGKTEVTAWNWAGRGGQRALKSLQDISCPTVLAQAGFSSGFSLLHKAEGLWLFYRLQPQRAKSFLCNTNTPRRDPLYRTGVFIHIINTGGHGSVVLSLPRDRGRQICHINFRLNQLHFNDF